MGLKREQRLPLSIKGERNLKLEGTAFRTLMKWNVRFRIHFQLSVIFIIP
jgi:hypothetical protein